MSGESDMQVMIDRARALGDIAKLTAKEAAPRIEKAARATAAAGTTPDGQPWAPKKDGDRAMANAADAITAKAVGPVVKLSLKGPEVYHHFSKKASEPQRQVIPDGGAGIPANVAAEIKKAATDVFRRTMGGG